MDRQMTWHNRSLRSVARQKSPGMGVLEDWPRLREQNFVALASKTPGLGLDHVVLEHIPVKITGRC